MSRHAPSPPRPRRAARASALGLLLAASLGLPAACRTGTTSAELPQLLDLDGNAVDPLSTGAPATVMLFVRSDCPISNRYAPELQRIHEQFADRGVAFWLVYPDPDESPEAIRRHFAEYAHPGRPTRDPHHAFVRTTGATVTPEAAVFDRDGRLVYVGRIDDRFVDFGKARAAPTRRDLIDAIEATLAGRPVEPARTRAVGCFIPDLTDAPSPP